MIGKKFIQIKPSFLQTVLNTGSLSTAQNKSEIITSFNNPGESVWGSGDPNNTVKKFKIRLSSKKSGKKLDINLKFSTNSEMGEW